LDSIRLANRI
jgi:transposase